MVNFLLGGVSVGMIGFIYFGFYHLGMLIAHTQKHNIFKKGK